MKIAIESILILLILINITTYICLKEEKDKIEKKNFIASTLPLFIILTALGVL